MKLIDLNEHNPVPFGPTPKFRKIYGHYCGPGNEGGEPIDDLDRACKTHDECYHNDGRDNCDCDGTFKAELKKLLDTKNLRGKQKIAALTMLLYFKRKSCH